MKAQELFYILGTETGEPINRTDNLMLAVNGQKTKVFLKSLFNPKAYKQEESRIIGISEIGSHPIVDNQIQISENISICAFNRNTEELVYFTKTEEPFFRSMDEEVDSEAIIKIIRDEYERLQPQEEEPQLIISEDPIEDIESDENETPIEEELEEEQLEEEIEEKSDFHVE